MTMHVMPFTAIIPVGILFLALIGVILAIRYQGVRVAMLIALPVVLLAFLVLGFLFSARQVMSTSSVEIKQSYPSENVLDESQNQIRSTNDAMARAMAQQQDAEKQIREAQNQIREQSDLLKKQSADFSAYAQQKSRSNSGFTPSINNVSAPTPPAWAIGNAMPNPDIYPSSTAAVRAAGKTAIEQVQRSYADKKNFELIQIRDVTSKKLIETLVSLLREEYPDTIIDAPYQPRSTTRPVDDTNRLSISLLTINPQDASRGQIRLVCHTELVNFTVMADYFEKPWADDFLAFASSVNSRGHYYVIGQCPSPTTSEQQAFLNARATALNQLRELVQSRLTALRVNSVDSAEVLRQVQYDTSSPLLADQFIQKYARPYGTVYTASVLYDARPELVEQMIQNVVQSNARVLANRNYTFMSHTAALLCLGVIIGLTYALLTMLTKGYFAVPLRVCAVLVFAGAVLILLLRV